jgi:GNAT superfamily N-acetyltransferase
MEIVESDQYRIRENRLHFVDPRIHSVAIPLGLNLRSNRDKSLRKKQPSAQRPKLRVRLKGRQVAGLQVLLEDSWRQVLPPFTRTIHSMRRGDPSIRIEMAIAYSDREVAAAIIKRGHYLGASHRGVMLLARIDNNLFVRRHRKERWGALKPRARSELGGLASIVDRNDGIVGALQIERFWHGDPDGRFEIRRRAGLRPMTPKARSRPGHRRRVVEQLGLYWISRVAVETPFRNTGIGSILCDAAREVIAKRMLPAGKHVELIRQMPIAKFNEIRQGKGDFLTGYSAVFGAQLAYRLAEDYLSRKAARTWDEAHGEWSRQKPHSAKGNPRTDCLAYYYARAGRMVIRQSSGRARLGVRK